MPYNGNISPTGIFLLSQVMTAQLFSSKASSTPEVTVICLCPILLPQILYRLSHFRSFFKRIGNRLTFLHFREFYDQLFVAQRQISGIPKINRFFYHGTTKSLGNVAHSFFFNRQTFIREYLSNHHLSDPTHKSPIFSTRPNLSTFTGTQISFIISPVNAFSILFEEENSTLSTIDFATVY